MSISERWHSFRDEVDDACRAAGRDPAEVEVVAVSKGHGASAVRAMHAAGARAFGESYAQDWRDKQGLARELDGLQWHWIGRLQSNKVKEIAEHAHVIHSVGRSKIVRELSKRGFRGGVLVQVDISREDAKAGVAVADVEALVDEAVKAGLSVQGLMGMAPVEGGATAAARAFAELREVRDRVVASHPEASALSMGMSGDWEVAVREGATLLRIGTRLFGPREG